MDTFFIVFGGLVLIMFLTAAVRGSRTPDRRSGSDYDSGGSDEKGGGAGGDHAGD